MLTEAKYVVFVQSMDQTSRVDRIIGPFSTWNKASDYLMYLRTRVYCDGNDWYIGIRELDKTVIQPM
jgi:hypothetical protein